MEQLSESDVVLEASPGGLVVDAPKLAAEVRRGAIALVGVWPDVTDEEIDEMIEVIYRSRATEMCPPPIDFSDLVEELMGEDDIDAEPAT